jgi:hypothetical protein
MSAPEPVSVTVSDAPRLLDGYMTVNQLAAELDIAPITVKRWAALKEDPLVTNGRRVVYRPFERRGLAKTGIGLTDTAPISGLNF